MSNVRVLPLTVFVLVAFYAAAAWGSVVSVNPVRVHLSPKKRSELIELRNSGKESARFQIAAHSWEETADGQMKLVPTNDLLFFPSLLEIKPGEARRVRVASSVAPGASERSYRIIVQQLPTNEAAAGTVRVLTNLNLPVFVQPATPKPAATVKATTQRGQVVVALENTGNAYFKAQSIRVVARAKSGAAVFEKTLPGWYVLARGRRVYTVDLPANACAEITSITATATTENGKASTAVAVAPGAACKG
jgi:fimbrial chaperone protein